MTFSNLSRPKTSSAGKIPPASSRPTIRRPAVGHPVSLQKAPESLWVISRPQKAPGSLWVVQKPVGHPVSLWVIRPQKACGSSRRPVGHPGSLWVIQEAPEGPSRRPVGHPVSPRRSCGLFRKSCGSCRRPVGHPEGLWVSKAPEGLWVIQAGLWVIKPQKAPEACGSFSRPCIVIQACKLFSRPQ